MNKLDELIQQLCPDGVEYRKLGEVCHIEKGKTPIQKAVPGEYPLVVTADDRLSCNAYQFEGNAICIPLISSSGHGKKDLRTIHYQTGKFALGNILCAVIPHDETYTNARFLYIYLLAKKDFLIVPLMRGGANVSLSTDLLKNVKVPIPPLEVQREIVRILDQFAELTAELTTELTARKKQYEYYRDELLTFGNNVPLATLGDVAVVTKLAGFEFTKYVRYSDSGNIIALRGLNVKNGKLDLTDVKYIDNSDFSKLTRSKLHVGDMLFTYVGTIGQVALIDEEDKYYLAPNVALIRSIDDRLSPQYMRYYFQSSNFWKTQINKLLQSSSMQNIPMEKIRKFAIPLPSLEEQRRIVSFLDRFDTLCNDLTSGLPAEIEARRKQYEYYRDKLLAFKSLEV